MWENMRNLVKYVAHICGIFFGIYQAYTNSSDEES